MKARVALRLPAYNNQTHSERPNSRYPAALRSQALRPQTGENTTAESSNSGSDGHALTPQALQYCMCFVWLYVGTFIISHYHVATYTYGHCFRFHGGSFHNIPSFQYVSLLCHLLFSLCISCEVIRGNNGSIYTTCETFHTRPACSKVHLQTLYGTGP